MARRNPTPLPSRRSPAAEPAAAPRGFFDFDPIAAAEWGERLRRGSLGLIAALVCARPYFPSEFAGEADTGRGLAWVLLMLAALGLAIAGAWMGGATRLRIGRADFAVLILMALVGLSATHAAERRMAVNLAWEWAGIGVAYILIRNLPRTRGESSALALALVASAVAVALYGLYQVRVEFPILHANYLKNPGFYLAKLGVDPDSPARQLLENRLLGSNEPYATFALANSLAGFLVGPAVMALAVGLHALLRREGDTRRGLASGLVLWAPPMAPLLFCLILTKSRSAYIGLLVGLAILAWRERRRFSTRALVLAGLGLIAVLATLSVVAAALGGLDTLVLTESTKSFRYRWEYWQGAWGVIGEHPWGGHGPGNFAGPYLRHKLPQASEQITDPHSAPLEIWATAGVFGLAAFLAALGLAWSGIFGPPRAEPDRLETERGPRAEADPESVRRGIDKPGEPARPPGWLLACAGTSWPLVVVLGWLDPFSEADALMRWVILGVGWLAAIGLLWAIWRRGPLPAVAVGAGSVALAVNLLAAGGIGMPAVALGLWALLALGQNLRDDRPCGRLRIVGGRWRAFGLAVAWSALVGSFFGAILPYWRSERWMDEAHERLAARQLDEDRLDAAYYHAARADSLSVRPWLEMAEAKYRIWLARGARGRDPWNRIAFALDAAAKPPRNVNSPTVAKLKARLAAEVLRAGDLTEAEARRIREDRAEALERAAGLDRTDANLHAELAEALAAVGQAAKSDEAAREALRLDRLTPHADRKLSEARRAALERRLSGTSKAGKTPEARGDKDPDEHRPGQAGPASGEAPHSVLVSPLSIRL